MSKRNLSLGSIESNVNKKKKVEKKKVGRHENDILTRAFNMKERWNITLGEAYELIENVDSRQGQPTVANPGTLDYDLKDLKRKRERSSNSSSQSQCSMRNPKNKSNCTILGGSLTRRRSTRRRSTRRRSSKYN